MITLDHLNRSRFRVIRVSFKPDQLLLEARHLPYMSRGCQLAVFPGRTDRGQRHCERLVHA